DGDIDVFIASYQGDHVLYAAGSDEVQQYAASFGLTGTDIEPFEDPDGDGILNFEEMAFNMNPAVADAQRIGNLSTATSGLPRIRIEVNGTQKTFFAETIRRISSETLDYRLEISPFLTFSTVPPGVTMTTSPLNANY